jgi:hypothetical protein
MFGVFLAAWIAVAGAVDGVERARRTSMMPPTQVTQVPALLTTHAFRCLIVVKTGVAIPVGAQARNFGELAIAHAANTQVGVCVGIV